MTDRLASVDLRLLARRATGGTLPASGDDLKNLVTDNLPNFSLCWASRTLMYLDRDDDTSPESVFSSGVYIGEPVCLVPNSGPGRWHAVAGDGVLGLAVTQLATPASGTIVTSGADEWSIMPDAGWTLTGALPLWEQTSLGVITYHGPDRNFFLSSLFSVADSSGANTTEVGLYWTLNGAGIGATTNFSGEGRTNATTGGLTQVVFQTRIIALSDGDTLQALFRSANGDDFAISRAHTSILPVD